MGLEESEVLYFYFHFTQQFAAVSPLTQDVNWTYIRRSEDVLDVYAQFTSCFYGRADFAYGLRLIVILVGNYAMMMVATQITRS